MLKLAQKDELARILVRVQSGDTSDLHKAKSAVNKPQATESKIEVKKEEASGPKPEVKRGSKFDLALAKNATLKSASAKPSVQKTMTDSSAASLPKTSSARPQAYEPSSRAHVGELMLPQAGCRVHFSGCLMHDEQVFSTCSVPYVEDQWSEYVGEGRYSSNMKAFPKAIGATFDSVAVDAGTRVTIFSEPNFKGKVLWDRTGPAIVVNTLYASWTTFPGCKGRRYSDVLKEEWEGPLGSLFPPEVRELSCSDMHAWNSGSLVIQKGESIPKELDDLENDVE